MSRGQARRRDGNRGSRLTFGSTDPRGGGGPTSGPFRTCQPAPADQPERLVGLVVTRGHYLVVGSPTTGSLLVFDLYTGGQPVRVGLPTVPDPSAERTERLQPAAHQVAGAWPQDSSSRHGSSQWADRWHHADRDGGC